MRTSSPLLIQQCAMCPRITRELGAQGATEASFTLFEAFSINFEIVVYSEFMHVDVDLH
jgi:hypothetical protein